MKTTLLVGGMTCNHCKMSVQGALSKLDGVTNVEVDLTTKKVEVEHDEQADRARMTRAIEDVGFEVTG